MEEFDFAPVLTDGQLTLRPMQATDHDALFEAASDPLIWAEHPARDRWQAEVFRPYFDFLLTAGGTMIAIETKQNRVIGCSHFYEAPDVPGSISIGFTFLVRDHWGGRTNRAMKTLMLTHAFRHFEAVWLHIAPGNLRSQTATARIGARFIYDAELNIGGKVSLTKCYRLDRADWVPVPAGGGSG